MRIWACLTKIYVVQVVWVAKALEAKMWKMNTELLRVSEIRGDLFEIRTARKLSIAINLIDVIAVSSKIQIHFMWMRTTRINSQAHTYVNDYIRNSMLLIAVHVFATNNLTNRMEFVDFDCWIFSFGYLLHSARSTKKTHTHEIKQLSILVKKTAMSPDFDWCMKIKR